MNTPTFGTGKLGDGSVVCSSCFKRITTINSKHTLKLKHCTLDEIKNMLKEKDNLDEQKKLRSEDIKKQILELKLDNISSFLGRREIRELPDILAATEIIDNMVQGVYNNGNGILVSTDRRLLFVDKGILYGLKVEDFPLDKISSIQYDTGLLMGSIKIHTSGNVAKIDNVDKKSARGFAEFVRNKLSQPKEALVQTIVKEPDVLEQLEKLAKLKESGIISGEEFKEQKKKFLGKL